jgi:hypothetical protein
MRSLCLFSLGLLLTAGCADTSEDYEVNKPVISEPAPDSPVVQPETDLDIDTDTDLDADDALDTNDATLDNATPGAVDAGSATSGAIENDAAVDETQPATP